MRDNTRAIKALVSPVVTFASTLLISATAVAAPPPARPNAGDAAKTRSSETLDEIVVTAQRRRQSEFDVPLSVSAISGRALQTAAITSIKDIVRMVPNANVTENP